MWYRIRVSVPNARRARFVVVKNVVVKKPSLASFAL